MKPTNIQLEQAWLILQEFALDVEAIGIDHVQEEWPGLADTYTKAIAIFKE